VWCIWMEGGLGVPVCAAPGRTGHGVDMKGASDPALAAVVKHYRHRRGLSQEDLAFNSNITIGTLSRIERGVTDPAWSSIRAIARALSVSLEELGAAVGLEDQQ
jgi:DNA-binding XRE family transcriptional regulator